MNHFSKTFFAVVALTLTVMIIVSGCVMQNSKPDNAAETHFPMLWRVTGDKGNTVYLFGTIHAGDERSDKVSEKLQPKLDECDALAVEFDIVDYATNVSRMANASFYMKNKDYSTVKEHMRPDLLEKSMEYLKKHDSYFETLDTCNLSTWSSILQNIELSESRFSSEKGADVLLIQSAKSTGMDILEVESPTMQTKMLAKLPDEFSNWEIEAFFETQDTFEEGFESLYSAWLNGEEAKMHKILNTPLAGTLTDGRKQLWNDYHKTIFTDRNIPMADKAASYIDEGKSVFFAVGAGHFLGDDGIVQLLTDKGYTVERVAVE